MTHWTPEQITNLITQLGAVVGAVTLLWRTIHGQKEIANNAIEHLSTSVPMETVAAMQSPAVAALPMRAVGLGTATEAPAG